MKENKKKYKPTPIAKIFTCHWYNPIFWIAIFSAPFLMFFVDGAKAFYNTGVDVFTRIKTWDLL